MRINHELIDFENVHLKSLDRRKGEHFRVTVFLGPKNTKLPVDLVLGMQAFGERAEYVMLETPGANALDFHVAFYLGRLVAEHPNRFFHIISKDTGFDPLVQHLKTRKVFSARSASIDEMPCFCAGSSTLPPSAPAANSSSSVPDGSLDELCAKAIGHLRDMKAAKPARTNTLSSTIQAKLGKDVPASTVVMVCSELVTRGHVKVSGRAVTYALPTK